MQAYFRMVNVEIFKLKRSFIWLIIIIAPLAMILNGSSNFIRFQDMLTKGDDAAWLKLYVQIVIWFGILLYPMSIGVLSILISRTEHAENSWKYLLALPFHRSTIYLAKLTNLMLLTGISILFLSFGIYLSGEIIGVQGSVPYTLIFGNTLVGWVASWPIISIQLWLSIRFSGIGIPMGISAITAIIGVIVTNSQYAKLYIWSYPALSMLPKGEGFDTFSSLSIMVISSILFIIFTVVSISDFKKRDIQ
ncbi:ABC transporter permease [Oceanobacillus sp. AG]|uniref:ABC transporter permease n=2 Tax=Oceanobacillus TaxID=182709 RepID=UPI0012EC9167|nr:ABC transporter permease [Oceanobacillus sp. AG]